MTWVITSKGSSQSGHRSELSLLIQPQDGQTKGNPEKDEPQY